MAAKRRGGGGDHTSPADSSGGGNNDEAELSFDSFIDRGESKKRYVELPSP